MNKKEKKEKCKQILHSCKKISKEDEIFLINIFKNHKEWGLKKGVGIKYIYVDKAKHKKSYNQKCFYIVRLDGTITDISYVKSIQHPSKFTEISKACRYAVNAEIENYRRNIKFGVSRCAITKKLLEYDKTHIDHYDLDFKDLVKKWLISKDEESVFQLINKTRDLEFETYFTLKSLSECFLKFHNKNTHLRAITSHANLTRKK
tara:strand:+ start:47 stop:658 length:612 start_codon:yes stop_codon:yes gene_type:complete